MLLLLQIPPTVASDNIIVDSAQTLVNPDRFAGRGLTVTFRVTLQPVDGIWYVIVAVPNDAPVATPVNDPMEAILVLLLLHVPPDKESDNIDVRPKHKDEFPRILEGNGLTVKTEVT